MAAAAASSSAPSSATCPSPPPIPGLIPRRWEPLLPARGHEADEAAAPSFTLLQWNVMADAFSAPSLYSRAPASGAATDWPLRRERILEEIWRWDPDIVTLQEVDHYHDCLEPRMAALGYRGAFMRKPLNQDGSATFVRASKFDVLSVNAFNYWDEKERPLASSSGDGSAEAVERVPSNQVALAVLLRFKHNNQDSDTAKKALDLLVVNTHLKAAKTAEGEKMRARQARQLRDSIQRQHAAYMAARPVDNTAPSPIPILLCGDFNARPPMSVDDKGGDECCYSSEAMPILLLPDECGGEEGGLLRFRSLYDLSDPTLYTTWKFRPASDNAEKEIKHCIDYILLNGGDDAMRLTHRLSIPTGEEVGPQALPCVVYPSDHLALGVRFAIV